MNEEFMRKYPNTEKCFRQAKSRIQEKNHSDADGSGRYEIDLAETEHSPAWMTFAEHCQPQAWKLEGLEKFLQEHQR